MMNDISRCFGIECNIRDKCKRYFVNDESSQSFRSYLVNDPVTEHCEYLIPKKSLEIEELVMQKIIQRRDVGRKKYGTTMERTDFSLKRWISEYQQENLDAAIYAEKILQILENEEIERENNDNTKI